MLSFLKICQHTKCFVLILDSAIWYLVSYWSTHHTKHFLKNYFIISIFQKLFHLNTTEKKIFLLQNIILSKRIKFLFMFLITLLPPFHKFNSCYSIAALFHAVLYCTVPAVLWNNEAINKQVLDMWSKRTDVIKICKH